jgi:hypothetical protein
MEFTLPEFDGARTFMCSWCKETGIEGGGIPQFIGEAEALWSETSPFSDKFQCLKLKGEYVHCIVLWVIVPGPQCSLKTEN